MKRIAHLLPAITAAALFAGAALAQNSGETGGGASTRTGAGIVTSGSAVPAGQQPAATDTTLGKQPGGTGAGMGSTPAGSPDADPKKAADGSKAKQATKTNKTANKSGKSDKAKKAQASARAKAGREG